MLGDARASMPNLGVIPCPRKLGVAILALMNIYRAETDLQYHDFGTEFQNVVRM